MSSWCTRVIVSLWLIAFDANAREPAPTDIASDFERHVAALQEKFASEHPGGVDDREWVKARLRLLASIDERAHDVLTGPRGAELSKTVDKQNSAELKSMVRKWGWITSAEFGVSAAVDAWQIVMHAGADLAFQREVLESVENLSKKGEGDWKAYAYLYDRIASNPLNTSSHGLQRYGSQGRCAAGKWEPLPVEDPGALDARRSTVGLAPQAESIAELTEILCTAEAN